MRVITDIEVSNKAVYEVVTGGLITHTRKTGGEGTDSGATHFYYYEIHIGNECVDDYFTGDNIRAEKAFYMVNWINPTTIGYGTHSGRKLDQLPAPMQSTIRRIATNRV